MTEQLPMMKAAETPFMNGVKKIFLEKMAKGKASPLKGWSARTMFNEIVEEQHLTPAEQDIAWGILTVDILGYTDKRIKDLEDGWQKEREERIAQGDSPISKKNTKGSSYPLLESDRVDSSQSIIS
tara:strand:+ start:1391 stop:1768 length:378 start_codon:yes stop_codon:yes gene_type:complete